MSRRAAATLAWSMWVIGLAAIAAAAVLAALNPPISTTQVPESTVEGAIWVSSWIGFGLVGAIIVTSRQRNRIGWILCGITFWLGLALFLPAYARYALVTTGGAFPLGEAAAWLATWMFIPLICLVVGLVILFPTGQTSAFGRWVLRVFLVLAGLEMVAYALRPGPIEGDTPPHNPLGIAGTKPLFDTIIEGIGAALTVIAILGLVDLVLRYRRSRGVERQQLRWFVAAVAAFPILFFLAIFLEETLVGYEAFDPVVLVFFLWGNGTAVAIGLAVTRHGLYEIDKIISRAVTYAVVSAALIGVYVGLIFVLTNYLPFRDGQLAVAASTLAVAALFNPLRRRVQETVDRRFNRSRYDADRAIQGFAARLRDQVELDELARDLNSVTIHSMQPASVALWVKDGQA